jgi:hypothetical protein
MDRPAGPVHVTVLRGSCADDETCPTITRTDDPGALYFVAEPADGNQYRLPDHFVPEIPAVAGWAYLPGTAVTDPAVLDAHASRIGPGERLYRTRIEDVPPALRKAVTGT